MTDAETFGLAFQHTTQVVSDFDVSKKFYTETLGFKELPQDILPERQMFVALGGGIELHIGEVGGVEIEPSDFNHIAFTAADFDGFLAHLKANGVVYGLLVGGEDYEVRSRPDGVRQAFFQDPDGYWLEVNDAH